MERWQNRVAVVSGASSGIGAANALDLVKAGCIVVGLARRVERVEELRAQLPNDLQNRLHARKCDVSDLASVNEAFDWIENNLGGIDIMVNNAGCLVPGQLLTEDTANLQRVLQTNVMGVIYCTQRAFKSMKERKFDGHIVFVNSVVGHSIFNPPPGILTEVNIYPATKHAVTAINETLRQELRGQESKIKVTSVSPGLVDTEIVPDVYKTMPCLKSEDISSAIMYAISTPPHVQIHEITVKPVGEMF